MVRYFLKAKLILSLTDFFLILIRLILRFLVAGFQFGQERFSAMDDHFSTCKQHQVQY